MKTNFKTSLEIPNVIIRDSNLNAVDFTILFKLKHLMFLHKSSDYEVDNNKLKFVLGIADNKTIKKSYAKLYESGYLLEPVTLIRGQPVRFILNTQLICSKKNVSTSIPINTLYYLPKIKYVGFRLLCYYSSLINQQLENQGYAFPSIETIKKHLVIHKDTVINHNRLLENEGLVRVERRNPQHDITHYINGKLELAKLNNHYIVNFEKLKESVNEYRSIS